LRLLRLSIRFDVKAQPPNDYPCVYIFWHRNLLLMTLQRVDTNPVVLVSSSRDGELIAGPLNRLGYHSARFEHPGRLTGAQADAAPGARPQLGHHPGRS
jgi:lysophospholipid acyltransferase (LPLAT)-like uncharacterized protein